MTTRGTQLSVGEIAVSAFGEAAVAERGERELASNSSGNNDLFDDTSQIAQILALRDPGERRG